MLDTNILTFIGFVVGSLGILVMGGLLWALMVGDGGNPFPTTRSRGSKLHWKNLLDRKVSEIQSLSGAFQRVSFLPSEEVGYELVVPLEEIGYPHLLMTIRGSFPTVEKLHKIIGEDSSKTLLERLSSGNLALTITTISNAHADTTTMKRVSRGLTETKTG